MVNVLNSETSCLELLWMLFPAFHHLQRSIHVFNNSLYFIPMVCAYIFTAFHHLQRSIHVFNNILGECRALWGEREQAMQCGSCTKILLTVRMQPAAIALNYSVENIRNDVRQKIIGASVSEPLALLVMLTGLSFILLYMSYVVPHILNLSNLTHVTSIKYA